MSRCCLLVLLLLPGHAWSQPHDPDPPLTGRPSNFSHIVGRYFIKAEAQPTEVFVEEPITLRVRIVGQGSPRFQPQRKNLHLFPDEVEENFFVEPVADQDRVLPDDNTWEFVYRLRPKTADVREIPGLRLIYYPSMPGRRGYQTTYAEPIEIIVKPKPPPNPEGLLKVVQAPEQLYRIASGPDVLLVVQQQTWWTPTVLILLTLGPPLVGTVGFFIGRRLFPDRVRRSQLRRSRAARKAVRALGSAGSAQRILQVLTCYLVERLDFPASEPTPHEVAEFLRRKGLDPAALQEWSRFLAACDACRFAPGSKSAQGPRADEALRLISAVETDPCLARSH